MNKLETSIRFHFTKEEVRDALVREFLKTEFGKLLKNKKSEFYWIHEDPVGEGLILTVRGKMAGTKDIDLEE
jgi:hypothetical protein